MPDDYKISDLSNVVEISNNDLVEISAVNTSSQTGYSSVKATITQLANKIVNNILYSADLVTTAKTIIGAINELASGGGAWTDVTGTLTAGSTSITLQDASITTSSTIEVYTDTFGVNPTNVAVATGSVTLTFEAQANNLGVKVRIS